MGLLAKLLGVDDMVPGKGEATAPVPAVPDGTDFQARVEAVLESVRPALHADGGDIELLRTNGRSAHVRLKGACDGCPSAGLTLRFGIEKKLKEAIPDFEELIAE